MNETLFKIPLYYLGNNPVSLLATAINDELFKIVGSADTITLKDEDLQVNEEGKIIIDLEPLTYSMKMVCGEIEPPKTFELPQTAIEILAARKEKRRLNALEKDAIDIITYKNENVYFYLKGEALRIRRGEKEVIAKEIPIVHGRKAVNIEGLDLGHPYLRLPEKVISAWEPILERKELEKLAMVRRGTSLLNGLEYYGFNLELPAGQFEKVQDYFEYFGDVGEMQGWLTAAPFQVARFLKIPVLI